MKKAGIMIVLLALALACRKDVEEKTRDAINEGINEGGKAVEETADKVVNEVSAHFEGDRGCKLELSQELKDKGIGTGKFSIEKDTVANKYNKLVVYLISEKDYNGVVNFKITDKDGTELGRTSMKLNSKAGEAGYRDVAFDSRTDIERKSTISIY